MDDDEIIDLTGDSPEKVKTKYEPMEVVDTHDTGPYVAQSSPGMRDSLWRLLSKIGSASRLFGAFITLGLFQTGDKPICRPERDAEQVESCLSFLERSGSIGKQPSLTGLINF
ncbi:hypothetical protein M514_11835 [Trichuris suis]|uniref:Uncharacterized protein n=1 Tax=Trichuris suis TaxID=68888 RepID=A0A085LQN6_9BILA|nr:hypothetical protein M513_11835 [Trichuris suis]KFD60637.1 hypothetical protein M514_11835 [Trichuris suis]